MAPYILPIGLLIASNVFMTFAWYGHLGHKAAPLWIAVMVSWGIAFFEYWLAVPANRIGHQVYSAAQLKTIQEVITLVIFAGFSVFWLKESLSWGVLAGFVFIGIGAALVFRG
ncbi:DMT family protein [Seohaeicola nanhaiensis]|uniref:DMT family protein n=1 Tax=Seohaeicola nanhaiensis TaxID=1387282 RepID=A0ABV9KEB8_9RHOB